MTKRIENLLPEFDTTQEALTEALRLSCGSEGDGRPNSLSTTFSRQADKCSDDDASLRHAYQLLSAVTSLQLKPDDPHHPFEPCFVSETGRSPDVNDFSDQHVDLIQKVADFSSDHVLRARLCDFVWVRKKDHNLGRLAVESYGQAAIESLTTANLSTALDWLRRGLQIAAFMGKDRDPFVSARSQVESLALDKERSNVIVCSSLDILSDFGADDPKQLASVAEERARSENASAIWQRHFWEQARRWHLRSGDERRATSALEEIAKTFEREANDTQLNSAPPLYIRRAHFLERAIQAYRRVPGSEKQRERLHDQLLEVQEKAAGELQLFSTEVDLSDAVRQSRDSVREKPLDEALDRLAMCCRSPDTARIRKEATDLVDKFVLQSMLPATTIGPLGKVIAKQDVMTRRTGDDRESQIMLKMFWLASVERKLVVAGCIEPIRWQILADHHVRDEDLTGFVTYNALVPPGREPFFVRGLLAGLYGNFIEALHVLVPQIEHSIRSALSMKGVITSSLDDDGIQKEHDLNTLLYRPEITQLFSEHIVFDLRCLLVEQASINFRNQMAHGMLEAGSYFSESAIYIWWLILHLCSLGSLATRKALDRDRMDPGRE